MRLPVRPTAAFMAPLVTAALFTACSSSSGGSPAAPGDAGADAGNLVTASFQMEETVMGGQEIFDCQYVTLPDVQAFMIKGQHEYTPGSHHLLLYTTDLTTIPAGQTGVQSCYEGTGSNSVMSHVNGVLYAGQVPMGSETLPPGVGLETTPSQVLLFQVHYLNATASAIDAHVSVHLTTQTTPVKENAGILFFYDPFIDVPQGAGAVAAMRCPIKQNITLFSESSHYHARGVGYQAYLDPPSGAEATTPFYTSSNWASPTIALDTMQVPAGSYIRYYCDYDNTAGTQAFFQGQSAAVNEMCMFIGMYYPAMTTADEECYSGDMYGTGTVSCVNTLSCLAACPPAPADAGAGSGPQQVAFATPCIQQCFAQSCPDATAVLEPALNCIQSSCGSQCATSGSACDTCVADNCATQYEACANAACGTVPAP